MLREMLERHEGRRNKPYKCSSGKLTIGVGHNINAKGLPPEMEDYLDFYGKITDDMINRLLDDDIEDAITDAKKLYPDLEDFGENRMNALIDFVFNVGYKTAAAFKNMNKAVNDQRWDDAANMLLQSKYARQVGQRAQEIADLLREG